MNYNAYIDNAKKGKVILMVRDCLNTETGEEGYAYYDESIGENALCWMSKKTFEQKGEKSGKRRFEPYKYKVE